MALLFFSLLPYTAAQESHAAMPAPHSCARGCANVGKTILF